MGKKSGEQIGLIDSGHQTPETRSPDETRAERNARRARESREYRAAKKRATLAAASNPAPESTPAVFPPEAETQTPPLEFQTETVISPEAPPPESQSRPRRYRNAKREAAQQAEVTVQAVILMAMLDGVIGSTFGEDARRNEIEKQFTDEALGRMMTRLDPVMVDAIQKYTDPVMFIVGLTMWGARVYRLESDKRAERAPEPIPGVPTAESFERKTQRNGDRIYNGPPATTPPDDILNLSENLDGVRL